MFQTLKLIPSHVFGLEGEMLGVMGFSVAAAFLVIVPFLDRHAAAGRPSRIVTAAGIIALIYMVVFTIYGYLAA
jgi:quinol-cytochrome oxidoreductase complex cytochrome b subunit